MYPELKVEELKKQSDFMIGAGGALFAGIDAVLTGADTFLGGAAFGASVGASGGAIMGAMSGVVADLAGAAKGFVDQYWS